MNKTQTKEAINNEFFDYVESNYGEGWILEEGMGGRMYVVPRYTKKGDDIIEYSLSQHTICTYNWGSDETKQVEKDLNIKLSEILQKHNK